jgi:hypothetical protein
VGWWSRHVAHAEGCPANHRRADPHWREHTTPTSIGPLGSAPKFPLCSGTRLERVLDFASETVGDGYPRAKEQHSLKMGVENARKDGDE